MPVFFLPEDAYYFPHPFLAESSGFLAIGGNLNYQTLLTAYKFGIFPWFNPGEEIQWYFTNPRMVLYPEKIKISKSMRSYFNQKKYVCTYNEAFLDVILNCRSILRDNQQGTWISGQILEAYMDLHERGYAKSVEVWEDGELIGGLYGVQLGQVFYGESMFAKKTNASKFALISLCKNQKAFGDVEIKLIDCQQETNHLKSMGAEVIDQEHFLNQLKQWAWT